MIIETLSIGPIKTNCYLAVCRQTQAAILIDPGWPDEAIGKAIAEHRAEVKYVLNTHAHWDHIGGNAHALALCGAPFGIHPDAIPMLRAKGGADLWGIPLPPSPEPTVMLQPGQLIEAGKLRFEVLYTPGHAPGHVSFYERKQGVLFDGDVLFKMGVGRTDLPGGDSETLMKTIHEQLLPLPDETMVYSGHGPVTTIGEERRYNPFLY